MATAPDITRSKFQSHAPRTVSVELGNGLGLHAACMHDFKPSKPGEGVSLGWNLNTKGTVTIDGQNYQCQIGLNITLIGSKLIPTDSQSQQARVVPTVDPGKVLAQLQKQVA